MSSGHPSFDGKHQIIRYMARPRSLTLAAVNITVQPPNPKNYVQLWTKLFDLHRAIKIRGDQMMLLGRIEPIDKHDSLAGFRGFIFRFTQIDLSKPWFDLSKGEEADAKIVAREVKIPADLCPNLTKFAYVFFPKSHRLIFESSSTETGDLSPAAVAKFITSLSAQPEIASEFPNCDTTMEQDLDNIEAILKTKMLKRLVITVKKPNPDGASPKITKLVFDQLDKEGLQQKTLALRAAKGGSIKPSEETNQLASVAASNGSVVAVEEDAEGKPKMRSSKSKPRVETTRYDHNKITLFAQLEQMAHKFASKLTGDDKWKN